MQSCAYHWNSYLFQTIFFYFPKHFTTWYHSFLNIRSECINKTYIFFCCPTYFLSFRLSKINQYLFEIKQLSDDDRYALICRPFTHHVITSKKSTLIQITTLTVFALSSGIFELYQMTRSLYSICDLIIDGVMCRILPLIVTFVLTVLVICEFRRINRTSEDSVRTQADSRQGEGNVTRTMIAVNVAFIVLVLPAGILSCICDEFLFSYCSSATPTLFTINFSINIFIYTLLLSKFRTFFGYFKWKCCKLQVLKIYSAI